MNAGGAETFLMKILRRIDRTEYILDFCVADQGKYDDEIKELGGKIHFTVPKSAGFISSFKRIRQIVKENNYEYVMRISQHSLSALDLLAAKSAGAKVTVFRSSNTRTYGGGKQEILHKLFRPFGCLMSDVKLAPSLDSADFMFGKDSVKKGKAKILHNAVDLAKFHFSAESRNRYRNEFGINDKFVVGHVGRFNSQKNHSFLIEIFAEILKIKPESVLLLVGDGELKDKIILKAEKLGISQNIIFTGVRSDVSEILSAMDVFVFPSFFEGMPNTVIEAQATGLSCVISDTITKDADITGLVRFASLSNDASAWADMALSVPDKHTETTDLFIKNKYDIQSSVNDFVSFIFTR